MAHRAALISVSIALSQTPAYTLPDHGYGASVSRGVSVYSPAEAGTNLYCLVNIYLNTKNSQYWYRVSLDTFSYHDTRSIVILFVSTTYVVKPFTMLFLIALVLTFQLHWSCCNGFFFQKYIAVLSCTCGPTSGIRVAQKHGIIFCTP